MIIQNDRPAHASIERTAAWYCLGQSVLTLVWWGWLVVFPEHRAFFWPEDWPPLSLNAFCLADILFIAVFGLIVSAFAFQRSSFLRPGLWLMLGAIGYASAYTISVAIGTGQGLLGATCMGMATIGFAHLAFAELLADRDRVSELFRTASNATTGRHRLATLGQLSLMWPTILGLFPWAVWQLEQLVGIPGFYSSTGRIVGVLLFGMVSVVNLGTAWTLTGHGAGTPFPYDKTRELVVSGAYGWIRNPMAVTGLLQGICVGLMLGSPLVLVYVICGAAIWQFLVRPVEEQMMEEQFGASYVAYKAEVNCWLPRLFRQKSK